MSKVVCRTVTLPDGTQEAGQVPCLSPMQYRKILETETIRYITQAGTRFLLDRVPLQDVGEALYERGF
jgi:hypothetical protein